MGEATENLSAKTNPALSGLLNASFGNAPEIIIGIFAIQQGLINVVKASLTGSIIGNLLFVMGASMLAGGLKFKTQKFSRPGVMAAGSTLLVAVAAMTMPAIFSGFSRSSGRVLDLSVIVAVLMILTYIATVFFNLRTHKHLYLQEVAQYEDGWSAGKSMGILVLVTIFTAWISQIFVGSIEATVKSVGLSEIFIGVVIVAVVGNIAEHVSAIMVAVKNRMDLATQISLGSAVQIAMFVAPVLVLASLFLGHPMSLVFTAFELVAIILAVLIANFVVEDGESHWLEGVQLLAVYSILAFAFYFL